MDEFLKFFNENKDAFLAFGVLLTFIISMLNFMQTRTIERKSTYNSYVTNSRAEWLNKTREFTASYISLLDSINLFNKYYTVGELKKISFEKIMNNIYTVSTQLTLSFNCTDSMDIAIIEEISHINEIYLTLLKFIRKELILDMDEEAFFEPTKELNDIIENFITYKNKFLVIIQVYFKTEWDRIKDEAQGKKVTSVYAWYRRCKYFKAHDNYKKSDNKTNLASTFYESLINELELFKETLLLLICNHALIIVIILTMIGLLMLIYMLMLF